MISREIRSVTFLLAWVIVTTVCHASFYPWEELLDDMRNDVDAELPDSFIINFQKDIIFRMSSRNGSFDMEREMTKTRTSARHTPDTEKIGHESNFNLYLFELMITRYGISKATALRLLRKRLTPFCQSKSRVCDPGTPYRSIDGSCNNMQNPFWGASFKPFDRILPAAYADGFNEPRGGIKSKLPNPRLISTTIHYDVINPDPTITNLVPQLGQFVDHDMTLAPEGDRHCCTRDKGDKDCWPISIPRNDPFFSNLSKPQSCMDFTRSTPYCFPAGTGIREQFNILTAFLDASQVYGSEGERAEELRMFNRGRLSVNLKNPNLLPTVREVEERMDRKIAFMGKYLAGDERVNEMPALTTLHILLVREHNRIADEIFELRPDWTDDKIYEEARRILIAEWQNVVYGEYLPIILGEETMRQYQLSLGEDEYSFYNPLVNPTIFHAFATAAYRFGHTLINGIIELYRGLAKVGHYFLKDNFFEPGEIERENGDGYNLILGGLMVQNAQTYDPFVTEALTNFLLRNRTEEFGSDLIARNIQRGREHGIPPYNAYRRVCKLMPLTSWGTRPMEIIPQTWELLQTLYRNPNDIDLFVGGLSEVPLPGAFSGATFNCLKAMQFHRTKFGDRFFFTHANQPGSFNLEQLSNIRKRTMGDIICENSDLEMTTINVFRTPSHNNPQIFCHDPTRNKLDIELLIESAN